MVYFLVCGSTDTIHELPEMFQSPVRHVLEVYTEGVLLLQLYVLPVLLQDPQHLGQPRGV